MTGPTSPLAKDVLSGTTRRHVVVGHLDLEPDFTPACLLAVLFWQDFFSIVHAHACPLAIFPFHVLAQLAPLLLGVVVIFHLVLWGLRVRG